MTAPARTLHPRRAERVQVSPEKVTAALRAFFRIMEAWSVGTEDARVLLGRPGRSTLFKWKAGEVRTIPHDTMQRVSLVLGIYKALQILFRSPARADAWVKRPNADFGGRTALQHMLGGDLTDLAAVRRYLDAVRGEGA